MSLLLQLPRTYGHIRRLHEILATLARHGFSHMLERMPLAEHVPGFSRLRVYLERPGQAERRLEPAERMRFVFEELGATFIKFGQLLATRPDMVPPEFIRAFERLQDQVEPVGYDAIRSVLETSLEHPVDEVFATFDPHPVASGSIGQVHFATLHDGAEVVVKIKRPGTDEKVTRDLELLEGLAPLVEEHLPELRILRPRVMVEEFSRAMHRELDFVGEASYAARLQENLEGDETVQVPRIYWDYVSRDTLVLERMRGIRLTDEAGLDAAGIDRKTLAETVGRIFMRQFFITGFFHADPHPGNIFVHHAGRIGLIDFGQMGHLSDELRRKLALTVLALAGGNTDMIVDLYADIGVFTEETDLREFKSELGALIDRYYGVPADRLDMGTVSQEAMAIARRNGILLPREFVLLTKSFVTIMGTIQRLHPDFQFDAVVRPFSREIMINLADPFALGQGLGFYAYRLFTLLRRVPDDLRDLLEKARAGRTRIIFHHEGLDRTFSRLERAMNRLTLGIIIAAVTMGSAILLNAGEKVLGKLTLPYLGNVPLSVVFSGLGFSLAVLMGFALAWSIFRSQRF